MLKSDQDKYLGDIVTADFSNAKNINARCGRGLGINTNIMNILKEVCLGKYYFKVAVLLRESLLFSSMLLNSECWFKITKTEVEQLQSVDHSLLSKVIAASRNSPRCSVYLELPAWLPAFEILFDRKKVNVPTLHLGKTNK